MCNVENRHMHIYQYHIYSQILWLNIRLTFAIEVKFLNITETDISIWAIFYSNKNTLSEI